MFADKAAQHAQNASLDGRGEGWVSHVVEVFLLPKKENQTKCRKPAHRCNLDLPNGGLQVHCSNKEGRNQASEHRPQEPYYHLLGARQGCGIPKNECNKKQH